MKPYLLFTAFFLMPLLSLAGEQRTISTELKKESGFLKYQGEHNGVEVVALSNDIGSAQHAENLSVYFRDKKQSRKFHTHLTIPFASNPSFREFQCRKEGAVLKIETRETKSQKFKLFLTLQLP